MDNDSRFVGLATNPVVAERRQNLAGALGRLLTSAWRAGLHKFRADQRPGAFEVDGAQVLPTPGTRNIRVTRGSRTTLRGESMRLLRAGIEVLPSFGRIGLISRWRERSLAQAATPTREVETM